MGSFMPPMLSKSPSRGYRWDHWDQCGLTWREKSAVAGFRPSWRAFTIALCKRTFVTVASHNR